MCSGAQIANLPLVNLVNGGGVLKTVWVVLLKYSGFLVKMWVGGGGGVAHNSAEMAQKDSYFCGLTMDR